MASSESATFTVKGKVPVRVGVPTSCQFAPALVRVMPGGSDAEPGRIDQVNGAEPPYDLSGWLYGAPTRPSAAARVAIANVRSSNFVSTLTMRLALCGGIAESLTVTPNEIIVLAVGAP